MVTLVDFVWVDAWAVSQQHPNSESTRTCLVSYGSLMNIITILLSSCDLCRVGVLRVSDILQWLPVKETRFFMSKHKYLIFPFISMNSFYECVCVSLKIYI